MRQQQQLLLMETSLQDHQPLLPGSCYSGTNTPTALHSSSSSSSAIMKQCLDTSLQSAATKCH